MAKRVLGLLVTDEASPDTEDLVASVVKGIAENVEVALIPEELAHGEISLVSEDGSAHSLDYFGAKSVAPMRTGASLTSRVMGLVLAPPGISAADSHAAESDFERVARVIGVVSSNRVPKPGWFIQVQRNAEDRSALLDEFGALDSDEVADIAGSQSHNRRATAHRWQDKGKIFSIRHGNRTLYPGFQFDPMTHRPKPAVAMVLQQLPELKGWELALWWTTPMDLLDWKRPVDLLNDDPNELLKAAQAESREWSEAQVTDT